MSRSLRKKWDSTCLLTLFFPLSFVSSSFFLLSASPFAFSSFSFILTSQVYVCVYSCLYRGCAHTGAYHNKQSKYPVGIHTFSFPLISLQHSESQLIPAAHVRITQPAKASWMTSDSLSNTHTQIYPLVCMHIHYACTRWHTCKLVNI